MKKKDKELIGMWIKSIKKTIQIHEEAEKEKMGYTDYRESKGIICPLCNSTTNFLEGQSDIFSEEKSIAAIGCQLCPWVVFKGKTCTSFIEEDGNGAYNNYPKSIKRLNSWLDILENKPEEYLVKTNKWRKE